MMVALCFPTATEEVRAKVFDDPENGKKTIWFARIVVLAVFIMNVQCAISFIVWPEAYMASYALSGLSGKVVMRSIGIAFLMWNATYPAVIWSPYRHKLIFAIVLLQQVIGLIGESLLCISILGQSDVLVSSLLRFIIFDGVGLALMAFAFILVMRIPESRPYVGYVDLTPRR